MKYKLKMAIIDFLKNNWFKLGILIVLAVGVGAWIKFQYETLRIERYQVEQSAMSFMAKYGSLPNEVVGSKELLKFRSHFWNLFNY